MVTKKIGDIPGLYSLIRSGKNRLMPGEFAFRWLLAALVRGARAEANEWNNEMHPTFKISPREIAGVSEELWRELVKLEKESQTDPGFYDT